MKTIAVHEKEGAGRMRYLTAADQIAYRAPELRDPQVAALLALQAFNFNKKYAGYEYNHFIYNALSNALVRYRLSFTQTLVGHFGSVPSFANNENDGSVFSAGTDGKIIQWKLIDGTWHNELFSPGNKDLQLYSLAVSPDGKYLSAGGHSVSAKSRTNYAMLYDLKNPDHNGIKITGYEDDISTVIFRPDSQGFYALCNSGKSIVFSDLSITSKIISPNEKINALALNARGQLVGAGDNGNVYTWDPTNNFAETVLRSQKGKRLLSLAFLSGSNRIITGDSDGEITITDNKKPSRILSGHSAPIVQIKLSHTGKFIATCSKDGMIKLWNLGAINEYPVLFHERDSVYNVAFSSDDSQLMTGLQHTGSDGAFAVHCWPTALSSLADQLRPVVKRNLTKEEWDEFLAGFPYEKTIH